MMIFVDGEEGELDGEQAEIARQRITGSHRKTRLIPPIVTEDEAGNTGKLR
jgi:hypothetical protein